ncbi:MAG: ComEC/Rec2 family competence protein [Pseudomonadota bacterium]
MFNSAPGKGAKWVAGTAQLKSRGVDGVSFDDAPVPQMDERLAFKVPTVTPSRKDATSPSARPRSNDTKPSVATKHRTANWSLSVSLARVRNSFVLVAIEEVEYGTLFLTVPVFLIVGSVSYYTLPAEPALHNIPAILILASALTYVSRSYRLLNLCCVALAIAATGALIAQLHTHWRATPMMGSAVVTTVTGRVLDVERRPGGAARYTVAIEKTERPRLRYAPDIVRITSRKENSDLVPGTIMRATAQLRAASAPVRRGGYDFAFQAYFAGYGANGFSYGTPETLTKRPDLPSGGLSGIRVALADRIVALAPDRAASAVAAALIAGKKSAIPEEVNDVLRRTGLAHILAISGLHMALVAGTTMFLVRLFLSWDQSVAARRQTKKWAALAALSVAAVYLLLAGASVATQRSFIMLSVMLLALCFDRPALTKRNLAIAAIIIVALAPHAVVTPGFQMSFAATLALIGGYDLITRWRAQRTMDQQRSTHPVVSCVYNLAKILLGLTATAIIAGIATGIFSAYHFHRIAPLSLFANVAAMPIVTFVTMPTALLAMVAMPFGMDGWLFPLMFGSIDLVIAIATYFAEASASGLVGAMTNNRMLLLTAALLLTCIPRTAIRLFAVVPLALAILPVFAQPTPILYVSSDAKQIALTVQSADTRKKALAVNRNRPNRFTIDQWAAASAIPIDAIIQPTKPGQQPSNNQFHCDGEGLCIAEYRKGKVPPIRIAAIEYPERANFSMCEKFDLIIEGFAPGRMMCPQPSAHRGALIITAKQLSLNGAVQVFLNDKPHRAAVQKENSPNLRIVHAIPGALRPWHAHRVYSRSARNLAPYNRQKLN